MRNKLKKMMKKEEGFTLVELLAVIVILGIIVAIAIPTIGNVIGTAEESATEAEQELIIDAARLYEVGEENPTFPVSVGELESSGYLDSRSNDNLDEDIEVNKDSESGTLYIGDLE